jgi:predicted secreted protein
MSVRNGFDYAIMNSTGVTFAGGRDASLAVNAEVIDLTHRDNSNWQVSASGTRSWSMTTNNVLLSTASALTGKDMNITTSSGQLKGVTSATISFNSGNAEVVNNTDGYDTKRVGTRRSYTLSVTTQMYDESDDLVHSQLQSIWFSGGALNVTLSILANFSFSGVYVVTSINRSSPYEGIVECTYELSGDSAPISIVTTGMSTNQAAIWTAFASALRVDPVIISFGPKYTTPIPAGNVGKAYYRGTAILSEFSLTVPFNGEATLDATWQGTGAIAKLTVPAS